MVARLDAGHARTDIDDDSGALMPENRRKKPLRVAPGQGKLIRMADAGRLYLDQHLEGFWAFELNSFDCKRFAGLEGHRGANIHNCLSRQPDSRRRVSA